MAIGNYDIGGMLARSGQVQGQQMGQAYSQLGRGIEGMLGGIAGGIAAREERKNAESAQQQFDQILGAYQNNPDALRTSGQQMMTNRDPNMQRLGKMLVDEANRVEGVQTKAEEKRVAATTGRGKGELLALANNPQFNVMDQKQQSGYLRMSEVYGVSREDAMRIALEALENRKGKDGDFRKTGETTIRDEEGNEFIEFSIQDINNPDSDPITKTVPVGSSPNQPVGKTQIISSTTGASAFDKPRISGEVRQAQEFSELQVQAANELPNLQSDSRILKDAVASLETMDSQGIPEVIENKIRSEFGVQDPDIAQYELLVGELMYSRLKPLFGGVISEGERKAVEALYNNLKRGNPANKRILMQLQKKIEESIVKANLIRKSNSFKEYNTSLDKLYPSAEEQPEENVIDFSQLP